VSVGHKQPENTEPHVELKSGTVGITGGCAAGHWHCETMDCISKVIKHANKTKQNKTKQNKTKQNKTKQNKTKQNKTKKQSK
jgi:hypothetical protein